MQRTTERHRTWQRRPGPRAIAVAAAVVAAALGLSACGGSGGAKNKDGLGTVTAFAPGARKAFPVLSGNTLDGATLDLGSLKGTVLVLNTWGSWCLHCREESPYLERVYEQYKAKGVEFVGIDTRDNLPQAKAFVVDNKLTYPSLVDGDSETLLTKLVGIVPLQAVPTTVIVDRDGKLAWRSTLPVDAKQLMAALDPILAER